MKSLLNLTIMILNHVNRINKKKNLLLSRMILLNRTVISMIIAKKAIGTFFNYHL